MLKQEMEYIFPKMHVTMSSLLEGDVVPLHDHGGHDGFLFIASGEVRIRTYSADQKDERLLKLVTDKVYGPGNHALVTAKNNVHSIEALKNTEIVDAFSVTPEQHIQTFLKIVGQSESDASLIVAPISLKDANIAQHILDKDLLIPKISVEEL